jgi:hypothetical protein
MALFDRTAKNLGRGPAVLFPADPVDAVSEALLCYDPALKIKNDRFVFREAALALAGVAGGAVVDAHGFPVDRPEDLLGLH